MASQSNQLRPYSGRGSALNPANRFETERVEAFDDGWGLPEDDGIGFVKTVVAPASAKSAINYNTSPDIPFDRSINPYMGCEHGCSYCFARPTHEYLGLSIGIDFETKIFAKNNAAALLERELNAAKYVPDLIALGVNTDAYQPVERSLRITRAILETLQRHGHPVLIITKSALILRDIDILGPMAERGLAMVHVSVTTLDRRLSRAMEPRAAAPHRRMDTIAGLARAGIPTGVLAAPMIPALNDSELEPILTEARRAGATFGRYTLLRLPHGVKEVFSDWLARHAPDKKDKVLNRIRDTRGGRLNDPQFGSRFTGQGEYAVLLAQRFRIASQRLGFSKGKWEPDLTQFRNTVVTPQQMSLDL
jgi:DNA repair photolyase